MPLLQLQLSLPREAPATQAAAAHVLDCTRRLLGKDPALTALVLQHVDPRDWFIAGRSLAAQGRHSFSLSIQVTDETNTKAEKARFMAATHAALGDVLGPLHEESYIHVHDVRAAAYGYGGRTQEWRAHHPDAC